VDFRTTIRTGQFYPHGKNKRPPNQNESDLATPASIDSEAFTVFRLLKFAIDTVLKIKGSPNFQRARGRAFLKKQGEKT